MMRPISDIAAVDRQGVRDLDRETAGLLRRGDALLVDAFVLSPVIIWLLLPCIDVPAHQEPMPFFVSLYWLAPWRVAVGYVAAFAYGTLMLGRFGRTVGMKWLGIRVTNLDGSDIGWRRAALRTAVLLGPFVAASVFADRELPSAAFSAFAYIGLLWILVDRAHQGYHDKLARTLVMRERCYQEQRALSQESGAV
jgi:uncharacterized RDD family membrane protein YckC